MRKYIFLCVMLCASFSFSQKIPIVSVSNDTVYREGNLTCIDSAMWAEYMTLYVDEGLTDQLLLNQRRVINLCGGETKRLKQSLSSCQASLDTVSTSFFSSSVNLSNCSMDVAELKKEKIKWGIYGTALGMIVMLVFFVVVK